MPPDVISESPVKRDYRAEAHGDNITSDRICARDDTAMDSGGSDWHASNNLPETAGEIPFDAPAAVGTAPIPGLSEFTRKNQLTEQEAAELAWLVETRRIIILRLQQWVIPVSTLVCLLLALLIEAGLVGTVLWILYWHPLGGSGGREHSDGSSTAVGGIIQGSQADSGRANSAVRWHSSPLPTPPKLPSKLPWQSHSRSLALLDHSSALYPALPVIGIPSAHDEWTAPPHAAPPKTLVMKLQPHHVSGPQSRGRGPQPDSRGPQPDASGGGGGGLQFNWMKPGAKNGLGAGAGKGRGRGPGVGGAGNFIVPPANPIMPLKYQFVWPAHLKNPKFQLTIRPNGTVARVKVLRSSGYPGIDQAIIEALEQAKCLPNIVGGKPVESKFAIRYDLTS